jgi:hypothetical protein
MFDLFNAPHLTDAGAKSVAESAKAFADFGAAALNSDAAKSIATSVKVVAWSVAIAVVGLVTIKVFHELRGWSSAT